ncbi:unnamed protein product [Lampetra fluviatilis]
MAPTAFTDERGDLGCSSFSTLHTARGAVGRAGTVAILQLVDNLAEVADGSESGDCVALSAVTPDPAPAPSTPPPPPPLPAYFPA